MRMRNPPIPLSLISVICFPILAGCRDDAAKQAQASQQSRQIFALDSEITAIRRELQEPVPDVTKEIDVARAEAAELDRKISSEQDNLKKDLAGQKLALSKFEEYRRLYVLGNK